MGDRFKKISFIPSKEEVMRLNFTSRFLGVYGGIKMAELAEIVRENIGKSSYQMRQFFQQMVKGEGLQAYTIEVNKKIVEKDTENEKVVRIKKGATLTPTTELREYQPVLIEDPETGVMYNLNIGSKGGRIYNDGNSHTIYHHCVLERIAQGFDLKKVTDKTNYGEFGSFKDGISIPGEMVTARLRVSYDEDWESGHYSDYVAETKGNLVVEGEQDKLFENVCKFVRGE